MVKRNVINKLGMIFFCIFGVLIVFCVIQINNQHTIIQTQKEKIEENRKYIENIGNWEVVGGSEEDILEGIDHYYNALSKYHETVQLRAITFSLIIFLFIADLLILGVLIYSKKLNS